MKNLTKQSSKIRSGWDSKIIDFFSYLLNGSIALLCLIPFIMVMSASISSESAITQYGFSVLPRDISFAAYETVFKTPMVVVRAYGVTILLTIVGTIVGLYLQTMTAYVLTRKTFEWRNKFSFFFYFTTLFNGGLVPYFILMTRYLKLKDNFLAMLLPLLFNVFNLLIMKSYISQTPESLIDAAKIDGCGEFKTMNRVIIPLIKPAMATVGLFIALSYWNDWYSAMLYINNKELHPLQYFLYQQVNNIEAYKRMIETQQISSSIANAMSLPTQTLKMALTVVVTGPIIFLYPFVQKYFVQGITIGAVKG